MDKQCTIYTTYNTIIGVGFSLGRQDLVTPISSSLFGEYIMLDSNQSDLETGYRVSQ